MDDMLGIVVAEDDSDCVSVCVRPWGLSWLCIEREHLKGNKRDNKQVEEKKVRGVMKEECESVWKLCHMSVDLHGALWSDQLGCKVVWMQENVMSKS